MRERAALYGGTVTAGPRPAAAGPSTPSSTATRTDLTAPEKHPRMTTVLIADDQPLQRLGFRMLLEGTPTLTSSARPPTAPKPSA